MTITCCIVVHCLFANKSIFRDSKSPYCTNVLPDDYRSSELPNGGVKMKINIFV